MSKMLTIREDKEVLDKLEELARLKMKTKSEITREALRDYIRRKLELIEIQRLAAKRYTEGAISFDELVELLGYDEARKVAFYKETAERSFSEGLSK